MKTKLYTIACIGLSAFALTSCLQYDDPGAELGSTQEIADEEWHSGDVDRIDFQKLPTEEGVKAAIAKLETKFKQSKTAQYSLRGGKEGNVPQAHAYQFQYSLGPDAYAQYFVVPHKDFPYSNATLTSSYDISEKFNGGPRGSYYMVKNALMPLLNHPMIDSIPEIKAVNLLYYSLAAQEMADLSGPFTYLEDKKNSKNPTDYNDLKTIYFGIVDNLDTIVACLKNYDTRPEWYKKLVDEILLNHHVTSRRLIYGEPGIKSYIAFANSLKLRMALHIVKADPVNARKWAEEAVASGVIEDPDDQQGIFPMLIGFNHPLSGISAWGDLRMSASLETLLMSLDHPNATYLWMKNSTEIENEKSKEVLEAGERVVGIRTGTYVGDGQGSGVNPYIGYSTFNTSVMNSAPLYFVKYAEVCFLRAEGAIRGWNMGGTAEQFYNEGIRNAYIEDPNNAFNSKYVQLVAGYMNKENPTPYVQRDPLGGKDWESLTKIGVKWNEADDREVKLEKIITQKYLALFPLSTEAWTELRRTGYPKLFPVLNPEDGDGTLAEGDIIRRIPWLPIDPQDQEIIANSGVPALGGQDFQYTRLWWDAPTPNF